MATLDGYLHSCDGGSAREADEFVREAARLHSYRELLERYEGLQLELRDANGRRLSASTLTVAKQLVPASAVREYVESIDPDEAARVDVEAPCYMLMARLDEAAAA